jgi:hypothetical protein
MNLFESSDHGGGKIKRNWILPVLLLFGLVLFLNVNGVSASTTNNTLTVSHTTTATTAAAKPVTPRVYFNTRQISAASSTVKAYYEKNNKLPCYVTINNHKVTMPQFLQLLTDDIYQLNNKKSSSIVLRTVKAPLKPVENVKSGTLTKTQYINLVKVTRLYIYSTGSAPNYEKTSLGTIKFQNLVYTFSKIVKFQNTNQRLPNTVSVKPTPTVVNVANCSKLQAIVDVIGYAEAKFEDVQGQSSPTVMAQVGYGDCWADSGWLYSKLSAAGVPVRIIGHTTGSYPLHRWIEINIGNGWQTWNYAKYNSQHHGPTGSGCYTVKCSV